MNMSDLIGYITGNPKREKIVETLVSGSMKLQEISKITRIPEVILRRILSEMKNQGVVNEENGTFSLTEDALKALAKLRGL
jgi:predicted transcriptional regulator